MSGERWDAQSSRQPVNELGGAVFVPRLCSLHVVAPARDE